MIQLQTSSLTLRPLRPADISSMLRYRNNPSVSEYQGWDNFGFEDAENMIETNARLTSPPSEQWFQLAMVLDHNAETIGDIGIYFYPYATRSIQLGITLDSAYQGKGLASEAIEYLLQHLAEFFQITHVCAYADSRNTTAQNLLKSNHFIPNQRHNRHTCYGNQWCDDFYFEKSLLARKHHESSK